MKKEITKKFHVEVTYNDSSEFSFEVELTGTESVILSEIRMITRGTLMATTAITAIAYNDEGFDVCSYIQ